MARSQMSRMMRYASAGIELMVIFALWLLLGWWLDTRWNTAPWLMLAGSVIGFGLGMYRLIRDAQRATKEAQDDKGDRDKEA